MNIIRINKRNINMALEKALKVLSQGGIIAYPTETSYGIGCKFDNEGALKRLYALKGRPAEKALPLIVSEKTLGMVVSVVNEASLRLIERFWPGPLTLLLPARQGLLRHVTFSGKVAVRIPAEPFAERLSSAFPITSTSANPSGMSPARSVNEVLKYFSTEIDLIIDGGRTKGGLPSTIADATGGKIKIIRQGAVRLDA